MTADRNIMFFRGFLFYYDGDMNKAINAFKSSYQEMSQNNRTL